MKLSEPRKTEPFPPTETGVHGQLERFGHTVVLEYTDEHSMTPWSGGPRRLPVWSVLRRGFMSRDAWQIPPNGGLVDGHCPPHIDTGLPLCNRVPPGLKIPTPPGGSLVSNSGPLSAVPPRPGDQVPRRRHRVLPKRRPLVGLAGSALIERYQESPVSDGPQNPRALDGQLGAPRHEVFVSNLGARRATSTTLKSTTTGSRDTTKCEASRRGHCFHRRGGTWSQHLGRGPSARVTDK